MNGNLMASSLRHPYNYRSRYQASSDHYLISQTIGRRDQEIKISGSLIGINGGLRSAGICESDLHFVVKFTYYLIEIKDQG